MKSGYLFNFNEAGVKDWFMRCVNHLDEKLSPRICSLCPGYSISQIVCGLKGRDRSFFCDLSGRFLTPKHTQACAGLSADLTWALIGKAFQALGLVKKILILNIPYLSEFLPTEEEQGVRNEEYRCQREAG